MMTRTVFITILCFGVCGLGNAISQDSTEKAIPENYRSISNLPFQAGEKLEYIVHYGIINAGRAVTEVHTSPVPINGRPVYHMVGIGKTIGAFNWFYKVRDKYETYVDTAGIFPWKFVRRVNEGGFIINQDYFFEPLGGKVKDAKGKEYQFPYEYLQDMYSAFYYARTLNFDTAKVGDIFVVHSFVDNKYHPLRIKYLGEEEIKIRSGKYRCMKFSPAVIEGTIFKEDDDLNVWITADKNKVPILAEAEVLVGSIKMEVVKYENLRYPIAKIE